jgi:hypothetical protein
VPQRVARLAGDGDGVGGWGGAEKEKNRRGKEIQVRLFARFCTDKKSASCWEKKIIASELLPIGPHRRFHPSHPFATYCHPLAPHSTRFQGVFG